MEEFPQIIPPELELALDKLDLELPQDGEGDGGTVGDREPRDPKPSDSSDAMALELDQETFDREIGSNR